MAGLWGTALQTAASQEIRILFSCCWIEALMLMRMLTPGHGARFRFGSGGAVHYIVVKVVTRRNRGTSTGKITC